MKNFTLALLAATAIGAVSVGSASAMPFNNLSAASDAQVQHVRVVCDRNGRCYNTNRTARRSTTQSSRYYSGSRYYGQPNYYAPQYGYHAAPRAGFGIGPFGFGVW